MLSQHPLAHTPHAMRCQQPAQRRRGLCSIERTNAKGTLRTVSNVISKVIYELDANGNLTSDGLRTFQYGADNRLAEVDVSDSGEAAKVTYLHNAIGQRTFKSEPQTAQTLPNQTVLGDTFIDWYQAGRMRFHRAHKSGFWAICGVKNARRSKGCACAFCLAAHPKIHPCASRKPHEPRLKNFGWLYATAQSNATIGTAYSYADPSTSSGQALPSWALLGEYGNGGASSSGRVEYIWLPTDDGNAIPVAMFRSNRYYSIHSDHLGTPRLIKDDEAKPVWQWSYSAFGDNKPTGVLKATANPNSAVTNTPALLAASSPAFAFNLRFPGQYADSETGLFYNYYRSYQATQGRYTQGDPIGLQGGMNRFGYVEGNAVNFYDPDGLQVEPFRVNPFGDLLNRGIDGPSTFAGGSRSNTAPPNLSPLGAGRQGAFNEAKRASGIPTSQQPICTTPNYDRQGRKQPGRSYTYEVPTIDGATKRVTIRDNAGGHNFGAGNSQNRGSHFNSPSGGHYDY